MLSEGSFIDVCVQLIKPDYIILSLPDNSRLAIAPTKAVRQEVCYVILYFQICLRWYKGEDIRLQLEMTICVSV